MVNKISLYGESNSGKTTICCKIITNLTKRKYKICAVKHHHKIIEREKVLYNLEQKDTTLFAKSGAILTLLTHYNGFYLFNQKNILIESNKINSNIFSLIDKKFYFADIVIIEGYKNANIAKIEIVNPSKKPLFPCNGKLLALIGKIKIENRFNNLKILNSDNIDNIVNFITSYFKL